MLAQQPPRRQIGTETAPIFTDISKAARHLAEICSKHSTLLSGRGAESFEIEEAKETFAYLGFPLPADLIAVYRETIGIAGIWSHLSILACPFRYDEPELSASLEYLELAKEESEEEGVLWLGQTSETDLVMDRAGQCSTRLDFRDDGTVYLIDPTDFRSAFFDYVAEIDAELRRDGEAE